MNVDIVSKLGTDQIQMLEEGETEWTREMRLSQTKYKYITPKNTYFGKTSFSPLLTLDISGINWKQASISDGQMARASLPSCTRHWEHLYFEGISPLKAFVGIIVLHSPLIPR